MTAAHPGVDIDRMIAELETLAGKSDAPAPAVTRVLYTEADLAARAYSRNCAWTPAFRSARTRSAICSPAGKACDRIWRRLGPARTSTRSRTPAGLTARLGCSVDWRRSAPCEWPGSSRSGQSNSWSSPARSRRDLASAAWEAGRLAGSLTPSAMAALRDCDGLAFDDVRRAAGFQGELADVQLPGGYFAAFVELHIEQGPLLERAGYRSALSPRSRHPPRCGSHGKERADTPAPS